MEVPVGFDDDLAAESTQLVNRIRALLATIHWTRTPPPHPPTLHPNLLQPAWV
ncbi:hypothetical protein GCM10009727_66800 [Actinomadura napierensis]|uniref:Uncharacterized protein n=1 Tax=Actinomadura napierensis TaxID=267854 RepID=A0ABP5LZY8_9ACTN